MQINRSFVRNSSKSTTSRKIRPTNRLKSTKPINSSIRHYSTSPSSQNDDTRSKRKKKRSKVVFNIKDDKLRAHFEGPPESLPISSFYTLLKIAPTPGCIHAQLDYFQPRINDLLDTKQAPLHICIAARKHRMVEDLIARGASVHTLTSSGESPLHIAVKTGDIDTVGTLLTHGANLFALSPAGNSPLMVAAQSFHAGVADFLLQHGAMVNQQNNQGKTALMLAAASSTRAMIETLHQHHADLALFDEQGQTAVEYAKMHKNPQMVNILRLAFENIRQPKFNDQDPEIQQRITQRIQAEDANLLQGKLFDAKGNIQRYFLEQIIAAVQSSKQYREDKLLPPTIDVIVHRHLDQERYFTSHQDQQQTKMEYHQMLQDQNEFSWKQRQESKIFGSSGSISTTPGTTVETQEPVLIDPFTGLTLTSQPSVVSNAHISHFHPNTAVPTLISENAVEKFNNPPEQSQRSIRGKKGVEVTTIRIDPMPVLRHIESMSLLPDSNDSDLIKQLSTIFVAVTQSSQRHQQRKKETKHATRNKRGKLLEGNAPTVSQNIADGVQSVDDPASNESTQAPQASSIVSADDWRTALHRKKIHLPASEKTSAMARGPDGKLVRRGMIKSDGDFSHILETSHLQSRVRMAEYLKASPKMRSGETDTKHMSPAQIAAQELGLKHISRLAETPENADSYIAYQKHLKSELAQAATFGDVNASAILDAKAPKKLADSNIAHAVNEYISRLDGAVLQAATLLDQFEGKNVDVPVRSGTLLQARRFKDVRKDAIQRQKTFSQDKADIASIVAPPKKPTHNKRGGRKLPSSQTSSNSK